MSMSAEGKAIASLNDVVTELVCGLAAGSEVTKGWAYTVVGALGDHTHELGGTPRMDVQDVAHWEGEE